MKLKDLTIAQLQNLCQRYIDCGCCEANYVCNSNKPITELSDDVLNQEIKPCMYMNICTFCEYRHDGGASEGRCNGEYESDNCKAFKPGGCITCASKNNDDNDCVNHRIAFDYSSCEKHTSMITEKD